METHGWRRKSIRMPEYDYATPGMYFITICAKEKMSIFWDNVEAAISRQEKFRLSEIGKLVDLAINQIERHYPYAKVDKYCIMPDHVHLILQIFADEKGNRIAATTVSTIVGQMKRWVSKQTGASVWQRSFSDRVIRNEAGYRAVWEYIEQNQIKLDFANDNIDFYQM